MTPGQGERLCRVYPPVVRAAAQDRRSPLEHVRRRQEAPFWPTGDEPTDVVTALERAGRVSERRRLRWRDYRTPAGRSPVRDFLMALSAEARAEVAAAMKDVRDNGMVSARHVRGEIYEVRASHNKVEYRVLFANEGRRGRILLSLEGFNKTTRTTPPDRIDVAEDRLREWRDRGE